MSTPDTIHLRITFDLHLSEEKIRQTYHDLIAVELLHVLRGGNIHPAALAHHGLTRDYHLRMLAMGAILGRENHGEDLAVEGPMATESLAISIEELTPPTIARDELCSECRHYPGIHGPDGCHEFITENVPAKHCSCKRPGTFVPRHL